MRGALITPTYVFYVVLYVLLLMFSAMVHEVAHGYVAYKCGDPTAKNFGRLTLNPLKHLDPFGSIVLPLLMTLFGGVMFSYAKPVPYNPNNLRNPKRDEVLVALAGPASNVLQAFLGAVLFNLWYGILLANPAITEWGPELFGMTPAYLAMSILDTYIYLNLMLCFFNLIPLPPLDGSKVLCYFLHGQALRRYYQIQQYAMPILIIVLYVIPRLGVDPVGTYLSAACGATNTFLLDCTSWAGSLVTLISSGRSL